LVRGMALGRKWNERNRHSFQAAKKGGKKKFTTLGKKEEEVEGGLRKKCQ